MIRYLHSTFKMDSVLCAKFDVGSRNLFDSVLSVPTVIKDVQRATVINWFRCQSLHFIGVAKNGVNIQNTLEIQLTFAFFLYLLFFYE